MNGESIDIATTKQTTLPPETLETLQRETFDYFHQLSHLWIDLHGIQDGYMRGKCIDYFENSRRATFVQRRYAIHNPGQFEDYGENCWGITASDGPGWVTRRVKCRDPFVLLLPPS